MSDSHHAACTGPTGPTHIERPFLQNVHSFRGFAMLNVVAVHGVAMALMSPDFFNMDVTSPVFITSESLFRDSTLYFAIISGVIYSVVLRAKGYITFFKNKAKNVAVPYVVCTAIFSFLYPLFTWRDSHFMKALGILRPLEEYPMAFLGNLVEGFAQIPYWYIPILIVLFLLTPLVDAVVFRPKLRLVGFALTLVPLVYTRPPFDPEVGFITMGALVYFFGAYVAGVIIGKNLQAVLTWAEKNRVLLAGVAVGCSIAIWLIIAQVKPIIFGIWAPVESLFYLQKFAISLLALYGLTKVSIRWHQWFKPLADAAFSIYFLHMFFIGIMMYPAASILGTQDASHIAFLAVAIAMTVLSITASLMITKVLRMVFGSRSRWLIGS